MTDFGRKDLVVAGVAVKVHDKELEVTSIDEAQRKAASMMAFWASVWASAEEEYEQVDARYRQWRSQQKMLLVEDEKTKSLADWKMTAIVESKSDFIKFKDALAKAQHNITLAKGIFESWDKHGNMAQSLGAMKREELSKTGSVTRDRRAIETRARRDRDGDDESSEDGADSKKNRLKGILKKKDL